MMRRERFFEVTAVAGLGGNGGRIVRANYGPMGQGLIRSPCTVWHCSPLKCDWLPNDVPGQGRAGEGGTLRLSVLIAFAKTPQVSECNKRLFLFGFFSPPRDHSAVNSTRWEKELFSQWCTSRHWPEWRRTIKLPQ